MDGPLRRFLSSRNCVFSLDISKPWRSDRVLKIFRPSDAAVPSFLSLSAAEIIRKSSAKACIAVLVGYCCARASFATRLHSAGPLQNPFGQPLVYCCCATPSLVGIITFLSLSRFLNSD
ncbi:hypothetical protein AVEN_235018-1 [Araneus ventricosus]|uniref:Uncharacterized protein n=1 Tax=Araneus ventricosus TaxID=182803 RepID=A0A4Y2FP82_ARAVE|nr:hypothetical protein AVEN_235018-1 [Araneus ventricosus]